MLCNCKIQTRGRCGSNDKVSIASWEKCFPETLNFKIKIKSTKLATKLTSRSRKKNVLYFYFQRPSYLLQLKWEQLSWDSLKNTKNKTLKRTREFKFSIVFCHFAFYLSFEITDFDYISSKALETFTKKNFLIYR